MSEHPYSRLTPDTILDAIEGAGFRPDGGMLALNSYENRVYQIGMEEGPPLVAKFYRPERWSDAAIREEHGFSLALAAAEIPVVPPLRDPGGETLWYHDGFRFALFPRQGGRWPELEPAENLAWIGRFLARIHQLGASRPFRHRPVLDPDGMGRDQVGFLLDHGLVPAQQEARYRELTGALLEGIGEAFGRLDRDHWIPLHGDCHPGNILWTDSGPHFVDMDDCRTGPAIQDLWMLLSGSRQEMALQLSFLREGYEVFRPFPVAEVALIEPLRTLRMIHYAAWIARRWEDPAFPAAFPWFGTTQYWQEHLTQLEQQLVELSRPPLPLY